MPYTDFKTGELIEPIKVPCGKCVGCRLDYSRSWADRCVLEGKSYEFNWFVTLTYDDDHIITKDRSLLSSKGTLTLYPKDLQDFLKRLRFHWEKDHGWSKIVSDQDPDRVINAGIRFYAAGEYGSTTFRPHYHILLFNTPIYDLVPFFVNQQGDTVYTSDEIQSIWGNGHVTIGEMNWQTAAYTARYVMKKQKGKGAAEHYEAAGIYPEFVRMSRKPGIGRFYFEAHKDEIYKDLSPERSDYITLAQASIILPNGREVNAPKYFDKIYQLENPAFVEFLKQTRRKIADQKLDTDLHNTDLDERGYFNAKEEFQKNSIKALTRSL